MSEKIDPTGLLAGNLAETLRALGAAVGEVNVTNGWDTSRGMIANPDDYDPRWHVSHKIAELGLIDTEISEAIEEVRAGHPHTETYYSMPGNRKITSPTPLVNEEGIPWKPEGVPSELADAMIRILDIADAHKIDLAAAIIEKLNHNATRGLHHGGKAL